MAVFAVTTLGNSGPGSFRSAIEAANVDTSGTPTEIDFAVKGTIALDSDLPAIGHAVVINGLSAPGYAPGGAPVVELACNSHTGLNFATGADGSQLLGLAVADASGNGVTLNAGSVRLNANYIGLDLQGAALGNRADGVYIAASSSHDQIGYNPNAVSDFVSNVISGNGGNGISLHGSDSNTLVDNRIGTNPDGTVAIANAENGIWLTDGADGNEIGGTAFTNSNTGAQNDPTGNKGTTSPVFVVPPLGNLVSGNQRNGILIDARSQNNVLNGNFVGTTADGNSALGNALDGVDISDANNNFLIGCEFVDNPFIYYNVLSGNGGNGLHITNSNNITAQANFFGTSADNATSVGNALDGVLVDGASRNMLLGGPIPLGNVSSGNGLNGVEVRDTASGFTSFNTFAGLFAFGGAAPNGNDGILVTATGGNQTLQTNVFSGNVNNGIEIGADASDVTVDPVIAGLTTDASELLPNGGDGLRIDGTAHDNAIGGYQLSILPHNIFAGNLGYGIAIVDKAHDNQVFNTYVGLNEHGTFGNQHGGILIGGQASDNMIGGPPATASRPVADIISGNTGNGITLGPNTTSTQILNNVIGYGIDGTTLVPNTGEPIVENGSVGNTISGNQIAPGGLGARAALPEISSATLSSPTSMSFLSGYGEDWIVLAQTSGQTLVGSPQHGDTFRGTAANLDGDLIKVFDGSDAIDVTDLTFSQATLSYNGNAQSGVLSVSDGVHSSHITLTGAFSQANFHLSSDLHGGTNVTYGAGVYT
jgi:parallel beta-helix repeat protein